MRRPSYLAEIERLFRTHRVVALLGPRQCGKTTLAKMFAADQPDFTSINYFDLEAPVDLQRLTQPMLALGPLNGLIVIDEIQRIPDLFPILRVLVDQGETRRFLLLGSASRDLIRHTSESLAGRIAYVELTPFSLGEGADLSKLWLRGGFPRSYLAENEQDSFDWRTFYIRTFLEQDIPNLGIRIAPAALGRFWAMLAACHGNILNSAELGRSFGASATAIRHYLDILSGTFMIRQLQPWWQNLNKRQVKAPKIYFRDTGILHSLLAIQEAGELQRHPKLGASWEGFALEELVRAHRVRGQECYFWATYSGAELDLLIEQRGRLLGFEFKYADAPKLTKSMQVALQDLNLDRLTVIYPGEVDYPLTERIQVRGLRRFVEEMS